MKPRPTPGRTRRHPHLDLIAAAVLITALLTFGAAVAFLPYP